MKKLVVLTGAGMSAESGIKTFRDADGLWEGHDVMEVATPEGFERNPELVLEFYNQRRKQLKEVNPNEAHKALAELENLFQVTIVTQNVDDLHERAGSSEVLHLHGELRKVRSTQDSNLVYHWEDDLVLGNKCKKGSQLRPHIVWFGEAVPMIERAIEIVERADILVIIGTSMQVYPAASLIHYIQSSVPIFFIDPKPNINQNDYRNLTVIEDTAVGGIKTLLRKLID
ncbi:NAD-dependent deacylase [Pseudotenacibaculum sp. MALMAid0570]|uniref:SIR2 family NAD-dependent protein deacylase n=1 Tax=Pseudotenacibaculum sp. MALMAid0570 TaxID=3143938 RepID=UPI0032DFB972